jgi:hypothetical protein
LRKQCNGVLGAVGGHVVLLVEAGDQWFGVPVCNGGRQTGKFGDLVVTTARDYISTARPGQSPGCQYDRRSADLAMVSAARWVSWSTHRL